ARRGRGARPPARRIGRRRGRGGEVRHLRGEGADGAARLSRGKIGDGARRRRARLRDRDRFGRAALARGAVGPGGARDARTRPVELEPLGTSAHVRTSLPRSIYEAPRYFGETQTTAFS